MQLGAPVGIAISNIIANSRNPVGAVGADLLPGYRAAFYSYAIMGGVGLVLTILFAANQDPARIPETNPIEVAAVAAGAGEEELDKDIAGYPEEMETSRSSQIYEMKESGVISESATAIFNESSTSLNKVSEKAEVK